MVNKPGLIRSSAVGSVIAAIICTILAGPARANSIEVNTGADGPAIDILGKCTLRRAIQNHNAAGQPNTECAAGSAGQDFISVPQSMNLSSPLPPIEGNVIIAYTGEFVCASIIGTTYITVNPGANVVLQSIGMTVTRPLLQARSMIDNKGGTLFILGHDQSCIFSNGSALPATGGILFNYDGGKTSINSASFVNSHATAEGGAIYVHDGTVTITDGSNEPVTTNVSNNSSDRGGAIWVSQGATLNITSSNFRMEFNQAGSAGGAIYNDHGTVNIARGIRSAQPVTNVAIGGNKSRNGGGLFIAGGNMTITGAEIENNSASEKGGGVYIDDVHPGTISQTYFHQNSANQNGGAVFNLDGELNVQASTFAFDKGGGDFGQSIWSEASGALNILNSTFLGIQDGSEGIENDGGGLLAFSTLDRAGFGTGTNGRPPVENSIIFETRCARFHDDGGNLTDLPFLCPGLEGNPQLASGLARNGGPTPTIAITSANSPAVGGIAFGDCRVGQTVITTDQRGATRPSKSNGSCTIGAYEYNATAVPSDMVPPNVALTP